MHHAHHVWPLLLLTGVSLTIGAARRPPHPIAGDDRGMRLGAPPVQSLGMMTFGPDGTLFVADSRGGSLYAIELEDSGRVSFDDRYFARDLDRKVAALLGASRDQIRFHDMAVHPVSTRIYLTVSRVDAENRPALVRVSGPEAVQLVDLDRVRFASTPIPATPSRDAMTPWGQPQWTLSVTDLAFVDGELYIAGLSNEQFASALRRVPFPFTRAPTLNTVEIFHTSHNRWETAAPIEAFLPITLDGVPTLLAGYGCAPIAMFRRADLTTTKHLRGRTVAELGGGNRPIDIIRYQKGGKDWILIANSHRTLMRMDPAEIARAPEMTTGVSQAYQPGGVGYLPVASAGVLQIDDFNADYVATLERDLESGAVNLVALSKRWL